MFTFLETMTFAQISWISVIVYILHIAEEGPRFVSWANRKPGRLVYTQSKFISENIIMFLIVLALVILLNVFPDNRVFQIFQLGFAVGYFCNAIFHGYATICENLYSPGTVTACTFFPLVAIIIFGKAEQIGILNLPNVLIASLIGISSLFIVVTFTHKFLFRNKKSKTEQRPNL
jgi:hypothetical protein